MEPASLTPRWVHFDERQVASGYPIIRQGSRGVYVCVAQDSLNTLGYDTGGLDGIFGNRTSQATRIYQTSKGIISDGIIGSTTWRLLMQDVVGRGRGENNE